MEFLDLFCRAVACKYFDLGLGLWGVVYGLSFSSRWLSLTLAHKTLKI